MTSEPNASNFYSQQPASPPLADPRLVDLLLYQSSAITIHALAQHLGLTVDQTQQRLTQLRDVDCQFDHHPQHGLRLTFASLPLWQDYLEHITEHRSKVRVYQQTASTQDLARQFVESEPAHADRAILVADQQTAGRGRLGRSWLAPPGTAVTFSRIHYTACDSHDENDRLTFAATVAVARALDLFLLPLGKHCQIKWPNDIYVDERKLAGILVESFTSKSNQRAAIIGIGINVSLTPDDLPADDIDLRGRITSLAMLATEANTASAPHRLAVLAAVIPELDRALDTQNLLPLLEEWRARCTALNQRIQVRSAGKTLAGTVVDLDPHAGLILRTDTGQLTHLPAATTTVI